MAAGKVLIFLLACGLLFQSACAPKTIYDWGSYNGAVARLYSGDPNYNFAEDIELLGNELEQTPAERIPPGKAAHLGFLYSLAGNNLKAKDYFNMEKRLFPESAVLMDRLIANLK